MALRRAIGSLAVRSQASYYLRRAAASPPTLTPPPPPPPSFLRPVTVPRRSFAAPPQHVKKAVKDDDDDDDAGPRLNNDITAPFLRLVTDEGHDVVPRHEALQMAVRMGLDLVEVHRKSDPPVCKIMDFHKEKYNKDVKEKERLKTKSAIVLRGGDNKEVRFKAKTEIKDLKVKADAITRLMERGYRVKCMAMPAGNEAEDLGGPLTRLLGLIQDVCIVESGPHLDSKHAYVIVRHVKFATKKGGKKASKAMEDAGKGTPRTAASESPATATDSGDEVSEHGLEAEDVDKTPGYIAHESSAQKEGQDRGFRGNNRGNMDNNMGNANANEGMAPEQTNRYASRRQQPGGVDSQGRPSQQDPRRSEHEGRYQRPPLEQPSPPPPRFNPGRPPQQDPRRSEHEGRYQRPPLEQPSPPPPRFNQGRAPQQDPRRNDNEDRYGFKVNQRPPLQQPGPPPPRFSQGSRPPQQDPRGNERGGHIPPYNSQRPQFQQSNPNAESAGNPASTAARSLGVFGSRKPATASEPKKTADGASSGGAGKPADAGPAKSFGIFSNPKKG